MKDKIRDERVVSLRRQIQSDAYSILISILVISILIQQFLLNAPFAQFAVEFICLIGMGIYVTIRYISVGVDVWNTDSTSNKKLIFNSLFSGIIITISLVVIAGERDIMNMVLIFIVSSVTLFIINFLRNSAIKKKLKRIDDELNDVE